MDIHLTKINNEFNIITLEGETSLLQSLIPGGPQNKQIDLVTTTNDHLLIEIIKQPPTAEHPDGEIAYGSFGNIFETKIKLIDSHGRQDPVVTKYLIKIPTTPQLGLCVKNVKVEKELWIQNLLNKTSSDLAVKTKNGIFVVKKWDLINNLDCRNCFLTERMRPVGFFDYLDILKTDNHGIIDYDDVFIDKYLKILSLIKIYTENLFILYKFKHNDLHGGNLLFKGDEPIFIDFGESTINCKFAHGKIYKDDTPSEPQIRLLHTDSHGTSIVPLIYNNLERFGNIISHTDSLNENDLIVELQNLYKEDNLSDLHFFILGSYPMIYTNGFISNVKQEFPILIEQIYKFSRLSVRGVDIIYKSIDGRQYTIRKNNSYPNLFRLVRKRISLVETIFISRNITRNPINFHYLLLDLQRSYGYIIYRFMAFFVAVYMKDIIDFSMLPQHNVIITQEPITPLQPFVSGSAIVRPVSRRVHPAPIGVPINNPSRVP